MEEADLAEPSGRRSSSSLVCRSGLWVGALVGPGFAAAAVWLQVKQRGEPSSGCLPFRPRLTTPRRCTVLHSLTWEDEKEHQMFFVLLTL